MERFLEPDTYSLTTDLQGTQGALGQRYETRYESITNVLFLTHCLEINNVGIIWTLTVVKNDI